MDLTRWQDPDPGSLEPRVGDFLHALPGPTAIHVTGADTSRTRVLVTLSHGNEPSGLEAIHAWLRSGRAPRVNVVIVLGGVEAARTEPMFYFRMLPGQRDLNRCFRPPFIDGPGQIADAMLRHIRRQAPEAVIDLHNTSGSNPPFSVTIGDSPEQRALSALFADMAVVTDLRLGSLMEQDFGCPVVTIEAGGSQDHTALRVAAAGLEHYFHREDVFADPAPVTVLEHPLRLELAPHARIDFSDRPLPGRDLTMRADIERLNFAPIGTDEPLGWLGTDGLDTLRIGTGLDVSAFFRELGGQLYAAHPMRLFMATTRADIAASDCLFYFVAEE